MVKNIKKIRIDKNDRHRCRKGAGQAVIIQETIYGMAQRGPEMSFSSVEYKTR